MSDSVISVEGLGKKYRIRHQAERQPYVALRDVIADKSKTLARRLWSVVRRRWSGGPVVRWSGGPSSEDFWALKDVSFEVKQGEVVGIIGRNGAGKSTLLKILSRITEPTEGRVRIKGRVASLLEVGTGFHPELTGRENIFLNGAILGMRREEIKRKFDEIVAFAEIEKFLDTPVKRYSSGMYVRLAFAVAAHLEPEILIVDEVLAVGDAEFQKKCLGKMQDVSTKEGRTVLFVSHNLSVVRQLCARSILLKAGAIDAEGMTPQVADRYLSTGGSGHDRVLEWDPASAPQTKEVVLHSVRVTDELGSPHSVLSTSKTIHVAVEYELREQVRGLRVYLGVQTHDGVELFESSDLQLWSNGIPRLLGRQVATACIPPDFLNIGTFVITVALDVPQSRVLIPPVQLNFTVSELGHNQVGWSMNGRPLGLLHPQLTWRSLRPPA